MGMLIPCVVLAVFVLFTLWPFVPKSRAALGDEPVISAPRAAVAGFDCAHAEVFLDRHPVERPSITITFEQRPPDRPAV